LAEASWLLRRALDQARSTGKPGVLPRRSDVEGHAAKRMISGNTSRSALLLGETLGADDHGDERSWLVKGGPARSPRQVRDQGGARDSMVTEKGRAGATVVGVDGCRRGWIAATLTVGAAPTWTVFPDADALWQATASAELILIDIPVGLPGAGVMDRRCD